MIRYRIDSSGTRTHLFSVELSVPQPAAEQRLSLPVWIPGSYLVREFARHLSSMTAEQDGRTLPLRQLDKTGWLARCEGTQPLVVRYRV
ncbi:MAG TPA: peptidase M61, partial [Caldimonas sp.]|nr:peptidase M61 [Caldimonas sp.]